MVGRDNIDSFRVHVKVFLRDKSLGEHIKIIFLCVNVQHIRKRVSLLTKTMACTRVNVAALLISVLLVVISVLLVFFL